MDPLSVAASAIAFLQAAKAIGQGVKFIKSLKAAPAEFCDVLNELSTLHALVIQLERILRLHDGATLIEQNGEPDSVVFMGQLTKSLASTTNSLESLVQKLRNSSRRSYDDNEHYIPRLRWHLEREAILRLRDDARQTREYITTLIASLHLTQGSQQLNHILRTEQALSLCEQMLRNTTERTAGLTDETRRSFRLLEDRIKIMERAHTNSLHELRSMIALAVPSSPSDNKILITNNFPGVDSHLDLALPHQMLTHQGCPVRCLCQCHRQASLSNFKHLKSPIGTFIISYNAAPAFRNFTCNISTCRGEPCFQLKVHYYLPRWLLTRAIFLSISYNSLTGHGASLHLRLPRVIKANNSIWEIIGCGDIDRLQERFSWRENSPMDVSPKGMNLVLHAMSRGHYKMITFLIQIGCDVTAKDCNGVSTSSTARSRLLTSDIDVVSEKAAHLYKTILQLAEERLHSYHSTLVHDSILGLSDTTLEEAIAIDPSSTESLDGLGYAPLHWAVRRRNARALTILLSDKSRANRDIRDRHGRTPLHIALSREDIDTDIQRQLLDSGCDLHAQDVNGKTPLHLACNSGSRASLVAMHELLRRGSNPNVQDTVNRFTPLNNLMHKGLPRSPWNVEAKIDVLVAAGAAITIPDKCGRPPILNAVATPGDATLLGVVLRIKGVELDVADTFGRGLLHYVAAYGDMGQIELLRERLRGFTSAMGCLDTEARDKYGHTPLSLIEWRARTPSRKLWANMRRPAAEEIESFRTLLAEVRDIQESMHCQNSWDPWDQGARNVEMMGVVGLEDNQDEDIFVDAPEYQA